MGNEAVLVAGGYLNSTLARESRMLQAILPTCPDAVNLLVAVLKLASAGNTSAAAAQMQASAPGDATVTAAPVLLTQPGVVEQLAVLQAAVRIWAIDAKVLCDCNLLGLPDAYVWLLPSFPFQISALRLLAAGQVATSTAALRVPPGPAPAPTNASVGVSSPATAADTSLSRIGLVMAPPLPSSWKPFGRPAVNHTPYDAFTGYFSIIGPVEQAVWYKSSLTDASATAGQPPPEDDSPVEVDSTMVDLGLRAANGAIVPRRARSTLLLWYRKDVFTALAQNASSPFAPDPGPNPSSGPALNPKPGLGPKPAVDASSGTSTGPTRVAPLPGLPAALLGPPNTTLAYNTTGPHAPKPPPPSADVLVPSTWQQLIALAARLNGTDWAGDGRPKWGICLNRAPVCDSTYIVAAIAASMAQSQGPQQGVYFDPVSPDMTPLVDTAAWQAALLIYKALLQYAPPPAPPVLTRDLVQNSSLNGGADGPGAYAPDGDAAAYDVYGGPGNTLLRGCEGWQRGFHVDGLCALAVQWDLAFQGQVAGRAPASLGVVGIAPLPGSTHVMDRKTGELLPCTADTCPYAKVLRVPAVRNAGPVQPVHGPAGPAPTAATDTEASPPPPPPPRKAVRPEDLAAPPPDPGAPLPQRVNSAPYLALFQMAAPGRMAGGGPSTCGSPSGTPKPGQSPSPSSSSALSSPVTGPLLTPVPINGAGPTSTPPPTPSPTPTPNPSPAPGPGPAPGPSPAPASAPGPLPAMEVPPSPLPLFDPGLPGPKPKPKPKPDGRRRRLLQATPSPDALPSGPAAQAGSPQGPAQAPATAAAQGPAPLGVGATPASNAPPSAAADPPLQVMASSPGGSEELRLYYDTWVNRLQSFWPRTPDGFIDPAYNVSALDYTVLLQLGHHPDDVRQFAAAYLAAVLHPNLALVPNLYGMNYLDLYIAEAAHNVTARDLPADAAAANAAAAGRWIFDSAYPRPRDKQALLLAYRTMMNYTEPPIPPPSEEDSSDNTLVIALAVALPLAALLFALAVTAALVYRTRYQLLTLRGRVIAPGPGPGTTLVAVDVMGALELWDGLPAPVIEAAVAMAADAIRRLLPKHRGYEAAPPPAPKLPPLVAPPPGSGAVSPESLLAIPGGGGGGGGGGLDGLAPKGTQGVDECSLLLAFHRPHHAVAFCLELQVELLLLDWPQPLLSHPHAAPLWLSLPPPDPALAPPSAAHPYPHHTSSSGSGIGRPSSTGTGASNRTPAGLASLAAPLPPEAQLGHLGKVVQPPLPPPPPAPPLPPPPAPAPPADEAPRPASSTRPTSGTARPGSTVAGGSRHPLPAAATPASGRQGAVQADVTRQLEGVLRQVSAASVPLPAAGPNRQPPAAAGMPYISKLDPAPPSYGNSSSNEQGDFESRLDSSAGALAVAAALRPGGAASAAAAAAAARAGGAASRVALVSWEWAGGSSGLEGQDADHGVDLDTDLYLDGAGGGQGAVSLLEALKAVWPLTEHEPHPDAPVAGQLFRGLRLRTGMACGVEAAHVGYDKSLERASYGGRCCELALQLRACAAGGQVLLASSDVARLLSPSEATRNALAPLLVYAGEYKVQLASTATTATTETNGTGSDGSANGRNGHAAVKYGNTSAVAGGSSARGGNRSPTVSRMSGQSRHRDDVSATATGSGSGSGPGSGSASEELESLHFVLPPALAPRLVATPYLNPRAAQQLTLGSLAAPVGAPTVACMGVVGAGALLAWRRQLAAQALGAWAAVARRQLLEHGGYIIDLRPEAGALTAVFADAGAAAVWAHACTEAMLDAAWPEELLEHELCEEWAVVERRHPGVIMPLGVDAGPDGPSPGPDSGAPLGPPGPHMGPGAADAAAAAAGGGQGGGAGAGGGAARRRVVGRLDGFRHRVLLRGLRLKVGLDRSPLRHCLDPAAGRVAYRGGRCLGLAPRIAALASSGQVLLSASAWAAAQASAAPAWRRCHLLATRLGEHRLPRGGPSGRLEVFRLVAAEDLVYEQQAAASEAAGGGLDGGSEGGAELAEGGRPAMVLDVPLGTTEGGGEGGAHASPSLMAESARAEEAAGSGVRQPGSGGADGSSARPSYGPLPLHLEPVMLDPPSPDEQALRDAVLPSLPPDQRQAAEAQMALLCPSQRLELLRQLGAGGCSGQ
ncbi:hypothetical protein HYH03_006422 [Edaphochlamys debaryana]|uniref:Uncharacterized protein n=1 Tax=Edaphochlamys debaryana TaxID=47281 RepID=A0A836C131_9CHLO|nr:hypothetical protein HYH03_006422 [Edaphochlamys debaryana]|eukprot:KAG2495477.1 hypothetical protein HYH03_006422 [Edaphochlamys debaryana]